MKCQLVSESLFFRIAFSVLILFSAASCNKNEKVESDEKVLENNYKEEKEAKFFIATANLSKRIISKSQIAQQKAQKNTVKELGKKLELQQNNLFQQISKIANKKLIIITEINAAGNDDLFELMKTKARNFDTAYLNDMKNELAEEIELLRAITKETKDSSIIKLTHSELPIQYELLRATEKTQREIN